MRERIPDPLLEAVEPPARIAPGVAVGKLGRKGRRPLALRQPPQRDQHLGKLMREQTQRHRLAWPDRQTSLPIEVHLAVATEAAGAHIDRLHHRAPAADDRSLLADDRPSADHDGHVRRRAAHVGDREIRQAAEEARADHAGGGAREHGLYRILEGDLGLHQGAVALHDHQRCGDRLEAQHLAERLQQLPDLGGEARVQGGGEGALRRIEPRTEFVAAGDRFRGGGADSLTHPALVRGIAHREHRGHRKGFHLRAELAHCRVHRRLLERLEFLAGRIMAAAHPHDEARPPCP